MGNHSRTTFIIKNATWNYVGKLLYSLLGLVNRTIIIRYLGVSYLGVNGLYANVLGILSLTEFGLSYAINYCLYKPIAENDYEKINAYVHYFKKIYRIIIVLILGLGSLIAPFLKYIVKDQGSVSTKELYIFYFIYLFNTAISYISAHNSSVSFAQQKEYLITNIQSISNVLLVVFQAISLIVFRKYLIYLLIHSLFVLITAIFINAYVRKRNPFLKNKTWDRLEKQETLKIRKQMSALLVSKIGEVCVTSSDNLIISALNGLNAVGIVSNYIVIIDTISSFTLSIINAFIPSFGNAIAVESKEKVNSFFKLYNFLTNWICGVAAICLFSLLTPLINVWVGEDYSVSLPVVACLALNFYMFGMRMCPNHVSHAAGLFGPNKYVSFIQGAVNLIISITLGKVLGVLGVFIGTIVSGLVPSIWRPIVIFKYYFKSSPKQYFTKYLLNLALVVATAGLFNFCVQSLHLIHGWITLVLFAVLIFVAANLVFILFYHKQPEFAELKQRTIALLLSIKKRILKK